MGTVLLIAILILLCGFAIYSVVHKARYGGGCCGTHDAPEKKIKVEDRDKSHYPFTVILSIDGMTCGNCVRRVENALNRLDGVWAQVTLENHQAMVHMKHNIPEDELRKTIRENGYTVLSIRPVAV